jgi:hypothetical protein
MKRPHLAGPGRIRSTGAFSMSETLRPGQPRTLVERSGTLVETEEDVRQAILSGLKGQQPPVAANRPAASQPAAVAQAPPVAAQASSPFCPTNRPPVPILTVFDDGKSDGEVIRIRDQRFIIGRSEGDLRIPIDNRISARHVEITLQNVGGVSRWVLTDLNSTHGMFVRVSRTILNDRAEILVGKGRYRFDMPQGQASATVDPGADPPARGQTLGWSGEPSPLRPPSITELIGNDIGNRMLLVKAEYWIGTDPTCAICRPDDSFCEPRHVRLFRSQSGAWHAEHNKTMNGLWLRMPQIVVESSVRFQIGEQRFQLKV